MVAGFARMRILFVNPSAELGGSERSLIDLFASLERSRRPIEKKLLLLQDGQLSDEIRRMGIDVEVLPLPPALATSGESAESGRSGARKLHVLKAALAIAPYAAEFRRAALRYRPALVHTNGMKAHLLAAFAVPNLPRIVHLRDFVSERPMSRRALPVLRRRALFVANSKAVEADALGVDPSLRTRVVYNGVDLDAFQPRARTLEHLAALSGLAVPPADAVVIGLVATYAWWKGHRTFLAAARRVRDALPEQSLRFYIVGGPVYGTHGSELTAAELRSAIEQAGLASDIGLVPFQKDVALVYQGLDVMVHASERPEPFGRTIVEAMASGRSVIVSRGGGAVELFEEGRTALGFCPGDAADLARKIIELVQDAGLRARLSRAARANAELRFGRERLADEILAAYDDLTRNA
jgi:glycosyltransferase involved in cell wall biosynthesis